MKQMGEEELRNRSLVMLRCAETLSRMTGVYEVRIDWDRRATCIKAVRGVIGSSEMSARSNAFVDTDLFADFEALGDMHGCDMEIQDRMGIGSDDRRMNVRFRVMEEEDE